MLNSSFPSTYLLFYTVIATLMLGTGCATTPAGNSVSETQSPFSRFTHAARTAFYDKGTWPLLLGAAVFRNSDYDAKVADYAMDHKPLFTTDERAERYTDILRSAGYVFTYGTALAVDETWSDSGKRVLTDTSALYTTRLITKQMNLQVDREYPNGGGNDAFGSHHAASPFAAAALTRRNVDDLDISEWSTTGINVSAYAIATASAWGRIEMGLHYPSDQLVSAAVGNFIAIIFNDAFLTPKGVMEVTVLPEKNHIAFRIPF